MPDIDATAFEHAADFMDHGLCMGNGHPRLKAVADEVIQSVDQDGVYQYLKMNQLI